MKKIKISDYDSEKIHSLISVKSFTWQDLCNVFNNIYTTNQIQYHVKKHYPDLKKNVKKEYSKGGTKLEYYLKQIFPASKISAEFHVGEKLRLDFIVLNPYNLAFEFDGVQHSTYSPHFHGSRHAFDQAIDRDERKTFLCGKRGLNLIRISQLDIDLNFLKNLIEEVGYGSGIVDETIRTRKEKQELYNKQQQTLAKQRQKEYQKEQKEKLKQLQESDSTYENPFAEQQKERQRLYRKEQYQKAKEWKKQNKK